MKITINWSSKQDQSLSDKDFIAAKQTAVAMDALGNGVLQETNEFTSQWEDKYYMMEIKAIIDPIKDMHMLNDKLEIIGKAACYRITDKYLIPATGRMKRERNERYYKIKCFGQINNAMRKDISQDVQQFISEALNEYFKRKERA